MLTPDKRFPLREMRTAAVDLRYESEDHYMRGEVREAKEMSEAFNETEMSNRIFAQFKTCKSHGHRNVVFSAFGCGAFCNPAEKVAALYEQAIQTYEKDFDVIVFAIYYPGSGPDSHKPFQDILCPRDD